MVRWIAILSLTIITSTLTRAGHIDFIESISIEDAIILAEQSNKSIFIETYATWCVPCRKLEKTLQDPEVAGFFNKNFINVRINMDDSPFAPRYKEAYDVIFLPTIIILNKNGTVRFKADRALSKVDLLTNAEKTLNPNLYVHSMTTGMESSPLLNSGIETRGPETIIHVMGKNTIDLPPDLIKQEAYFRLEFMDGSHMLAARRYLATQSDWGTPINLRFILDFVSDVKGKEWEYLILNKDRFVASLGQEQVDRTLQILIYNHLYQGFPRPTLDDAINYYSLINVQQCTAMGYAYILARYQEECSAPNYISHAKTYLDKVNPKDHKVMFVLGQFLSQEILTLKESYSWLQKAVLLSPNDIDYLSTAADVSSSLGECKKALEYINRAIDQANTAHRNDVYLQSFKINILQKNSKN